MTYGLTEPFLLWENKRQLVMHGAKKILKQRHQQRNTTAWKDRVQSAVHIYKVILPAAPARRYCLVLPQSKWQCSSSPTSQTLHPRQEGGDVNQSFLALMVLPCLLSSHRKLSQSQQGIILQAQLLFLLWLPFALPPCWGHVEISMWYNRTTWLPYFPLIIYVWIWLLPDLLFFLAFCVVLMYLNCSLHNV